MGFARSGRRGGKEEDEFWVAASESFKEEEVSHTHGPWATRFNLPWPQ